MDILPDYNLVAMGNDRIYLSKTTGYTPLFSYLFLSIFTFQPTNIRFLFFLRYKIALLIL